MVAEDLEALEALHQDLEALRENRLQNIDRLTEELEAHIDTFSNLLEHKKRSNDSRNKIATCQ